MKNTKKNTIILALCTVLVMVAIISTNSYAGSNTSFKSQGRIVYTNDTDDTSDDVIFDASDLVEIDEMITSGKLELADALNDYSNTNLPTFPTFDELGLAIDNLTTFSGNYYYDKATEGADCVRYIKINGKYYLCDENGVQISNTALTGTISVVSKDDTTEPAADEIQLVKYESFDSGNLSAGSAGYIDKSLVLGSGSDNINYRNLGYEDKLVNGELKLVFGDNVNFIETHNTYVSSVTVNGGTVSWQCPATGSSASTRPESVCLQTVETFNLSDYKYFMHSICFTSNETMLGSFKCYFKPKSGGSLIPLCNHHSISKGHHTSYYTDLSNIDYDKEEEYYLYFSCDTYSNPAGFKTATGSYEFRDIIFY